MKNKSRIMERKASTRFAHGQNAVGLHIPYLLPYAAGPFDFDERYRGLPAEAKMHGGQNGRGIPDGAGLMIPLPANVNQGTDTVAIAFRAGQPDIDPPVRASGRIAPDLGAFPENGNNDV